MIVSDSDNHGSLEKSSVECYRICQEPASRQKSSSRDDSKPCLRCMDMLQTTSHQANLGLCTMLEEVGVEQKTLMLHFEMVEHSDVLRQVQI